MASSAAPPSGSRSGAAAPRPGAPAARRCGRGSGRPSRRVAGKPRSSITAAIGIETFIVSGRPQASATASRTWRASATYVAADAALVGELEDPLGARVERLVHGMAEAGHLARRRRGSACTTLRRRRVVAASSSRAHSSAVPRITGPQPRIPAATAPCSEPGSAASVIRAATLVGIIPCSAIATSSRSRKYALVLGRLLAGEQQVEVLGEAQAAHQVAGEVAPADLDPVGIRLADVADAARRPYRSA